MFNKRLLISEKYLKNLALLNRNISIKVRRFQLQKLRETDETKQNLLINKACVRSYADYTSMNQANTSQQNQNEYDASSSGSVDPSEIKKFQALADSWWVENGEFEALHKMNMLRVPWIRDTLVNYRNAVANIEKSMEESDRKVYTSQELLIEPLLGLNVLDVGCGGGILSESLARLGANVTAIDACKENIISAKLRVESELKKSKNTLKFYDRLNYLNCTIEELAAIEDNSNYFDAVVMSEVVEHVNNLPDFLFNGSKLLKNNGFNFITTINRTTPSYLLAILAAEYVLGLVPKGTHNWEKFVQPQELKDLLKKDELFVKFEMGMAYNPLTKNWCWSKDNSVNFALYAQKFVTNTNKN